MSSRSRTETPTTRPTLDRTAALRALVPAVRRRIVDALLDWPAPVDERSLAASLAADDRDAPIAAVADSKSATEARAALQQIHLPALVDANLVTWDRSRGTVAPTDHPAYRDPMIGRLLADPTEEVDDVVDALADPRRRTALAAIDAAVDPVSSVDLAGEIARAAPDSSTEESEVLVSLRHVDLPKLEAAGLIEYDREDGTAEYLGHPAIDGPWFGWSGIAGSDTSTGTGQDRTNNEPE